MSQPPPELPAASTSDGSYPRPQLVRGEWTSLDGAWEFGYDDADLGVAQRWYADGADAAFDREIVVPFPPESEASGVHDPGLHPIVWYRRVLDASELPRNPSPSDRIIMNIGAIDYRATIWCNGQAVGEHVGGQTPFCVDLTDAWATNGSGDEQVIVVRAHDDSTDSAQPTGKQDWQHEPHGIWYQRTTGIWQTVWLEVVPTTRIVDIVWTPNVEGRSVACEVRLSDSTQLQLEVTLTFAGRESSRSVLATGGRASVELDVNSLVAGRIEDILWSPENPALVDATLRLHDGVDHALVDAVSSYFGMRTVAVADGKFHLNSQPRYLRSVLDQGYWSQTHVANPGTDWLRREVELILELGFNAVRVHQKAEDPRFLQWADRLGLMVWAETANARRFSDAAVGLLTQEWADLVRRDRSHPCIVTWVPMNESWGIDDVATSTAQQAFAAELAALTRALDPTRPVVSNDGWEHVDSDIIGIHDYTARTWRLRERYGGPRRLRRTLRSKGTSWFSRLVGRPARRRLVVTAQQWERFGTGDVPVMLTEFGGIKFATGSSATWGYSTVESAEEYEAMLRRLFDAVRGCHGLSGFCYTQFLDTLQEANGLLTEEHVPKLPIATIREIVLGQSTSAG